MLQFQFQFNIQVEVQVQWTWACAMESELHMAIFTGVSQCRSKHSGGRGRPNSSEIKIEHAACYFN